MFPPGINKGQEKRAFVLFVDGKYDQGQVRLTLCKNEMKIKTQLANNTHQCSDVIGKGGLR